MYSVDQSQGSALNYASSTILTNHLSSSRSEQQGILPAKPWERKIKVRIEQPNRYASPQQANPFQLQLLGQRDRQIAAWRRVMHVLVSVKTMRDLRHLLPSCDVYRGRGC